VARITRASIAGMSLESISCRSRSCSSKTSMRSRTWALSPATSRSDLKGSSAARISSSAALRKQLPIYTLTRESIRYLPKEEVARRRREAEAARGARFRELYAMLGLRGAIHADGTLEITVGATGEATKGVMPCDGSGSPSITSTRT
jgi:hypothetical protein